MRRTSVEHTDVRLLDGAVADGAGIPPTNFFGIEMSAWDGLFGFYFCAFFLIVGFYISIRITRSSFGSMLRGIKTNQTRMMYTGLNTRPLQVAAFVISGMYAGLAGCLMAAVDPLAGAERMQWTASGGCFDDTSGGIGTLVGPVIGAAVIKYAENIFLRLISRFSWISFRFYRYARNLHRERGLVVCREGMAPNAWSVVHAGGDFLASGIMEGSSELSVDSL